MRRSAAMSRSENMSRRDLRRRFQHRLMLGKDAKNFQTPREIEPIGLAGQGSPAQCQPLRHRATVSGTVGIASKVQKHLPLDAELVTKRTAPDQIAVNLR
jgi:hypothetical protein